MCKSNAILLGTLGAMLAIVGLAVGRAKTQDVTSGVKVGGIMMSFHSRQVTGRDHASDFCPTCKYPTDPGVQVWINGDAESNVDAIAASLEQCASTRQAGKLKAFLVYYNTPDQVNSASFKHLVQVAARNHLKHVALIIVNSGDLNAIRDNEINIDPRIKNTVFVYKARQVSAKFVNFVADKHGLDTLETAVARILN